MSADDDNATRILGGDDARTVIAGAAGRPPPVHADAGAAHNALPVGTRLAEFEILGLVGEGGFGIVYLADDTSLGRRVAVKEYMPSALAARVDGGSVSVKSARHADTFEMGRRSFINEARLLARFDHPSLIKVYRFWEDNGTAYMAMPFYEGATLKETLAAMAGPPDEAWLRGLLAPLLDALAIIHGEQCFHRDIAPDNILLLKDSGRPLLLDFGAARRVIGGMTQDLTIILKPGYAPVEQYAEVPAFKQGPWTDLYALAASLHFAIRGTTPPEAVGRMLKDSYVPLAQEHGGRYGLPFLRAIDHALAVSPEQRPQSVQELGAELGIAVGDRHAETPAMPATVALPARARAARRPRWIPLAGGAVAAALAGVAIWFWAAGPSAPDDVRAAAPAVETGTAFAPPAEASDTPDTAAPPAAEAAPAPPATMFDELARLPALGDPAIAVRVDNSRPVARIGRDSLAFTIHSSVGGYLYVFALDPEGKYVQLFPNGIDGDHRIQANRPLRLPRDSWPMDAGEPAGVNRFLAVVSPAPRDFYDAVLPEGGVFHEFPLVARAVARQRGADDLPLVGTARCAPAEPDCNRGWGAAVFDVAVTR